MLNKKDSVLNTILCEMVVSVGVSTIMGAVKIYKSLKNSVIDIGEWDKSYNSVNRLIYKLNPEMYTKNRVPTTNRDCYELCCNIAYFVKIKKNNFIKIETYKNVEEKSYHRENRLKISFYGKERHRIREQILHETSKIVDDDHIRIQYLNEYDMNCDIMPHSFNNIVLNALVKDRLINGLDNWKSSKKWYQDHQLVYKIGILLYGDPGTGKSTIVRAISTIFNNAPILIIDPKNFMNSINKIIRMRKKFNGTIIVLIEDFDMFFTSREDINDTALSVEKNNQKDINQNAIFQLLDGIYSTDNTIYIATTNYKNRIDPALIRYGRFDIQEKMEYFTEQQALEFLRLFGYGKEIINKYITEFPVQPSYLQSKIMEYRADYIK